ncbi:MAG: WYL domain-containing protein [Deltaproteobacteria bacterium]|jgi:predicted DNA-binding transcriptional regulator YafY|nr:WYL domain-containing protein [Deltaproteobacteria bacterium]
MGVNPEDKYLPAEKILGLYTLLLRSSRAWSLQALRRTFNCSTSTMLRVIAQLEASRHCKVVKTKRGRESYYELDKTDLRLPPPWLTAEGLSALWLCRDLCESLCSEELWKIMGAALLQLTAFLEREVEGASRSFARSLVKGSINYSALAEELRLILTALRTQVACSLDYERGPGVEPGHFLCAPLELITFRDTLYLRGWLLTERGQPRFEEPTLLVLHRARRVRLLEKSTRHLSSPPLDKSSFGLFEEEKFRVTAQFQGEAARWVRERVWSADQTLEDQADGSLILSWTVKNQYETLSWLLGFGSAARVLEPSWLQRDLAEEARRVWELNGPTN